MLLYVILYFLIGILLGRLSYRHFGLSEEDCSLIMLFWPPIVLIVTIGEIAIALTTIITFNNRS